MEVVFANCSTFFFLSDPSKSSLPLKVPLFGASSTLVRAPGVVSPAPSSSIAAATTSAPTNVPSVNQLSVLQSRRLSAVRTLLHADQIAAISRPPVLAASDEHSLPSLEELLSLLAPYHVQQDMDNTPEAIAKGSLFRLCGGIVSLSDFNSSLLRKCFPFFDHFSGGYT